MAKNLIDSVRRGKNKEAFDTKGFIKALNKSYLEDKNASKYMRKNTFSPSTIGYGHGMCPRYWFHAFNGTEFKDSFTAPSVASMLSGTAAHERLQSIISKMEFFKELEREILSEDPPVRGFADFVLEKDGKEIVGEIKTIKDEYYDIRKASNSPSESHYLQLLIYMKIEKVEQGFILYENKNTNELHAVPVMLDAEAENYIDYVFDWMRDVYSSYKNDTMPERVFTESSRQCKGCPVSSTCWANGDGEVFIEQLEVR